MRISTQGNPCSHYREWVCSAPTDFQTLRHPCKEDRKWRGFSVQLFFASCMFWIITFCQSNSFLVSLENFNDQQVPKITSLTVLPVLTYPQGCSQLGPSRFFNLFCLRNIWMASKAKPSKGMDGDVDLFLGQCHETRQKNLGLMLQVYIHTYATSIYRADGVQA